MKALFFSEDTGLVVRDDYPTPEPGASDALIQVLRAGICSTDLEILRGYIPGFSMALGHEFVGRVASCASRPDLVGRRVVAEINCRCDSSFKHPDPIFMRNHYPNRTVLGIIGRDGCMAEYVTLPISNLHVVPEELTDLEACFAEPLAAACRVVEQEVIMPGHKVAVVGDGKLGMLIAQLLAYKGITRLWHFGRHVENLNLVDDTEKHVVTDESTEEFAKSFDVCIDATGSPQGVSFALELVRPLGTLILKSTCSVVELAAMPNWAAVANDVVVNEKRIIGSRCGPFRPALEALRNPTIKRLVNKMVVGVHTLTHGPAAIEQAQKKGVLKVQIIMEGLGP